MRKAVLLAVALLALLGVSGATALADGQTTTDTMVEQNNSGQSGTVRFTLSPDNTTLTVEINISGGSSVPQPAHIHKGSCDNLDPKPFYPLNNVVDGKSVTVITEADVKSLDYESSNQFAVNVHKSATEVSTYVSCGDIVSGGSTGAVGMPRTGNHDYASTLGAATLLAVLSIGAGMLITHTRRRI